MPLDAPPGVSLLAAPAVADPATSVMAIKQGLSRLAPSQLAELQSMLRQQRLHRQQQDILPLLPPQLAAPAPPAVPAVQPLATAQEFGAGTANAAVSIMQQVASAPTALANPSFAFDDAARVAFLQAAAAHLLQQHQQQYSAPAPVPAVPEQLHQQQQLPAYQQQWQQQQQQQHPGVSSCKRARNTARRSRRCFDLSVLQDAPAMQQLPAWQVMPGAAEYAMAATEHSMAPAVRAALLQQLQQLQAAEQQQTARRSSKAAAAGTQRVRFIFDSVQPVVGCSVTVLC
jgi:hypothetical protein